ncbi:MAG: SPOR domain-containing protein [Xanthomonadaceae bacterium]|nr:SPOR domain-containing protein [Xanthomonadaceae bacterium]MDE2224470.1 SPOR domain-containing protein [Xanthomonadaceae bacterium]
MKTRLLGAAVLIALAVIFVPMLLPGSNSGSQSVSTRTVPEPSGEMQTRVLQVGPDGASAGSSTAAVISDPDHVATLNLEGHTAAALQPLSSGLPIEGTTAPAAGAPSSAPVASAPAVVPPKPAAAVTGTLAPSAPAASAPAKAEPIPGGAGAAAGALYTVNLGVYANHAGANKLVANARQHGFAALATPETYQGKAVLRVRVGPFHSRAEAEAARLKLKDFEKVSMSIDSGVVNQAGDAPTSAIAANQPGGWAVQLAAYSDEASANRMRDRLRGQGIDGYVDSVSTAKGKLWRVRAGPFASRNVAESTRAEIAQKFNVKGNIVTQE